jgi:hypothetical protein
MRILAILALAAVLAAMAGCSSADPDDDPALGDEGRSSRPEDETTTVRLYRGERDIGPSGDVEDGSFTVPPGAHRLTAVFYANETGTCGAGLGPAPPREGEVFPNPFLDFVAPSGRVHSVESSFVSGCPAVPVSHAVYTASGEFEAEPGGWIVRHEWTGTNLHLTVIVDTDVATEDGAV